MIIPAILENNFSEINRQLARYADCAKRVQIDVTNLKINGDEELEFWDVFDFEFDLLLKADVGLVEKVKDLGASFIVFHLKHNKNIKELYEYAKQYDINVGICGTVEEIKSNIEYCDYVQVMGIENVGHQGQPFRESALDDIKNIKAVTDKVIQVDGAMNEETIRLVKDAGASNFVVGSALKNASDVIFTYRKLKSIVN